MGCRSDYMLGDTVERLRGELDATTRVACEVLGELEKAGVDIDEDSNHLNLSFSREVREWWREHKHRDAARRDREKQAAEEEADKEAALSKLSARERKLLGLK